MTEPLNKDSRAASDRARAENAADSAVTVVSSAGLFTIVGNVSDMTTIVITPSIDGKTIKVLGYGEINDGGGGYFRWDATSVKVANNGTVFGSNNSATGRWERIYDGPINVAWYGFLPSETADVSILNTVISSNTHIYIPPGVYTIDSEIKVLGSGKKIIIDGDLRIDSINKDPLMRINTSNCDITGNGTLRGVSNTPHGVVLFGLIDYEDALLSQANILWNFFENIRIFGNRDVSSVGIRFNTQEGLVSVQANYFNQILNTVISDVNIGVYVMGICNGQILSGIQGYRITKNLIEMSDLHSRMVTDCVVSDITIHFSAGLQNIIYLDNGNRNTFSNIGGEPGAGRVYNFTATTSNNLISGYNNCPNSPIDSGTSNIKLFNGAVSSNIVISKSSNSQKHLTSKYPTDYTSDAGLLVNGPDVGAGVISNFKYTKVPFSYTITGLNTFRVGNLKNSSAVAYRNLGAYEITISGFTNGVNGQRIIKYKGLALPRTTNTAVYAIDVNEIIAPSLITVTPGTDSIDFTINSLYWSGQSNGYLNIIIEILGDINFPTVLNV